MFSAARWRLTIAFTAVLAVIMVASGLVVYTTTRSTLFDRVDSDLVGRVEQDQGFLLGPPDPDDTGSGSGSPGEHHNPPRFETQGYFYALVDSAGGLISYSSNADTAGLASESTRQVALKSGEAYADTSSSTGAPLRVYVVPAQTSDGTHVLLQVGVNTSPEERALTQLRNVLMAVLAMSIAPAIAGGYFLSGRVLRPIKTAVDSQHTFVADASHELKTPIAVVRTNAEILERHIASPKGVSEGDAEAVADIISETDRLGKMVDQMLTLAQADVGQAVRPPEEVLLHEVVEDVGRSMKALAVSRGIELQTRIGGPVEVRGDRERLRELLVILVDNAIKYTDAGGRVELSLSRRHKNGTIVVSDTGHGIPAESLAHVFHRFYRVDKARSRDSGGTGLGLAIARHIVDTHGGSIGIQSEPGKGTTVTVELKARSRDAQPDSAPLLSDAPEPADR